MSQKFIGRGMGGREGKGQRHIGQEEVPVHCTRARREREADIAASEQKETFLWAPPHMISPQQDQNFETGGKLGFVSVCFCDNSYITSKYTNHNDKLLYTNIQNIEKYRYIRSLLFRKKNTPFQKYIRFASDVCFYGRNTVHAYRILL